MRARVRVCMKVLKRVSEVIALYVAQLQLTSASQRLMHCDTVRPFGAVWVGVFCYVREM